MSLNLPDLPQRPVSDDFGFDRGTPLDRVYIGRFLAERRASIRGHVLEVGDRRYTSEFDVDVIRSDVVDVDASNRAATITADLAERGSLPPRSFDCILLIQTLHLVRSPTVCIANCYEALREQGSLLMTAPALSRVSPAYPRSDFWRFTPAGMRQLLDREWIGQFSVEARGNLAICIGFLLGLAAEEVDAELFARDDLRFPVVVAVHAVKE